MKINGAVRTFLQKSQQKIERLTVLSTDVYKIMLWEWCPPMGLYKNGMHNDGNILHFHSHLYWLLTAVTIHTTVWWLLVQVLLGGLKWCNLYVANKLWTLKWNFLFFLCIREHKMGTERGCHKLISPSIVIISIMFLSGKTVQLMWT